MCWASATSTSVPAADCPQEETQDAVNLTDYDPQSVMHYFCGGVGTQDMKITAVDRQGARALYLARRRGQVR